MSPRRIPWCFCMTLCGETRSDQGPRGSVRWRKGRGHGSDRTGSSKPSCASLEASSGRRWPFQRNSQKTPALGPVTRRSRVTRGNSPAPGSGPTVPDPRSRPCFPEVTLSDYPPSGHPPSAHPFGGGAVVPPGPSEWNSTDLSRVEDACFHSDGRLVACLFRLQTPCFSTLTAPPRPGPWGKDREPR